MKTVRIIVMMALGAAGWVGGAVATASPAFASQCPSGGGTCAPDILSESGTLLASVSGTLTASGSFTATYTEDVYQSNNVFCSGCLDFLLQVKNSANSPQPIEHVNVSDFTGVLADIGENPSGASAPGSSFVNGTVAPADVSRSGSGAVITWDFTGTHELPPGATSLVLEVETNAKQFTTGTVSAQDGGVAQATGFAPNPPPPPNIAEVPFVPAMGLLGGVVVGGIALRRRHGV
ncbi:MAG: hypothetical protein JF886_07865 [Candidatus Dormibacteraeota bacterium]|uniref:Uncharacterized protein n=1 Tax=Candidatus Aeolococcus gillhamiae TaxID=3127015 RepID=A0A2W6ATZ2_9BACT|nr:hypothetical protein [Candidatus Dormibacteraeota bacterium]PZR81331.1 MAG: hypothetical protein DLM65_06075 [Candidatus Dormibacter sp. RRmetagenome_bin12]